MKLEEAIREIKLWTEAYKEVRFLDFYDKRYLRAIDTVLTELDRQKEEVRMWDKEIEEAECISDVGKTSEPTDNTTEKIEELDVKSLSNIFIANDDFNKMVAFSTTLHKLNEVIRYINKEE